MKSIFSLLKLFVVVAGVSLCGGALADIPETLTCEAAKKHGPPDNYTVTVESGKESGHLPAGAKRIVVGPLPTGNYILVPTGPNNTWVGAASYDAVKIPVADPALAFWKIDVVGVFDTDTTSKHGVVTDHWYEMRFKPCEKEDDTVEYIELTESSRHTPDGDEHETGEHGGSAHLR